MAGLIGKKIGMTRIFNPDGKSIPVTVIKAGPCKVIQKKTEKKDGYKAVQLGFEPTEKRINKPMLGHFKKAGLKPFKKIREFRLSVDDPDYKVGDTVTIEMFNVNEKINCTSLSKGKGFTGVIKKYGFHGGPKTHGQSNKYRAPGSIGSSATPSRVIKGMKMAGHKGAKNTTVKNLKVIIVDNENSLLTVKGTVPGWKGNYVLLKKAKG
ncbi:50S ribosomal protein L3 [bacterium]|nr:50S ribosomal protein L3 [bacterium]